MNETNYSPSWKNGKAEKDGLFELRVYKAGEGKLGKLDARFRDHTIRIFEKHGMKSVAYWHPLDEPDSKDTLVYIIKHENREAAKKSWKGFLADPNGKRRPKPPASADWPSLRRPLHEAHGLFGHPLISHPTCIRLPCLPIPFFVLFTPSFSVLANGSEQNPKARWTQSYDAGYLDKKGVYAGGSEIAYCFPQGKTLRIQWVLGGCPLGDPPDGQKQSAQVLRLDSLAGNWQVDLDMGQTNDRGLALHERQHPQVRDLYPGRIGQPSPRPQNLLVMAAGEFRAGGAVSSWTRDDETGAWVHTLIRHGSSVGGIRWVPRDMEVYQDKKTGIERIFLSLGNPGIISGVYDPSSKGKIKWSKHLEFPFPEGGSLHTRPLGIVQANGSLMFSEGGAIFRRKDGVRPSYEKIIDLNEDTDTDARRHTRVDHHREPERRSFPSLSLGSGRPFEKPNQTAGSGRQGWILCSRRGDDHGTHEG